MTRLNAGFVFTVLVVSLLATVQAADKPVPDRTPQSQLVLKVSKETLTIDARNAPLAKVFDEIGKQGGIAVEVNVGSTERVTMRFDNVPLEEGIKRLSNNVTILYGAKPNDIGHGITKIIVLAEDKQKVTQPQDVKAGQSSKPREPGPRPAPFKFEFDPTKPANK